LITERFVIVVSLYVYLGWILGLTVIVFYD